MIAREGQAPPRSAAVGWPAPAAGWAAVTLLALAYLAAFVDRTALALLVTPIKRDLGLTDTELGLLTGAAYGVINALAALPAGHLSDRWNRKALIAGGMLLFGLATWSSAFAAGFLALFLARSLVGIGEATLHPAATSMIADLFPPERRSRAYGVYIGAAASAITVVFLLGGPTVRWLTDLGPVTLLGLGPFKPWQASFLVAGAPGLILALVILLFLREPARRDTVGHGGGSDLADVFAFLARHKRAFACHLGGSTLILVSNYALLAWVVPWLERAFGFSTAEASASFALTAGLACLIGTPVLGELGDRLRRGGRSDANYLLALAGGGVFCGAVAAAGLAPTSALALTGLAVAGFFLLIVPLSCSACVNELAPNALRARISAGYNLVIALGATSAGPFLVGLLNDEVFGLEGVGQSLATVAAVTGAAGVGLLLWGQASYANALAMAERDGAAD